MIQPANKQAEFNSHTSLCLIFFSCSIGLLRSCLRARMVKQTLSTSAFSEPTFGSASMKMKSFTIFSCLTLMNLQQSYDDFIIPVPFSQCHGQKPNAMPVDLSIVLLYYLTWSLLAWYLVVSVILNSNLYENYFWTLNFSIWIVCFLSTLARNCYVFQNNDNTRDLIQCLPLKSRIS